MIAFCARAIEALGWVRVVHYVFSCILLRFLLLFGVGLLERVLDLYLIVSFCTRRHEGQLTDLLIHLLDL